MSKLADKTVCAHKSILLITVSLVSTGKIAIKSYINYTYQYYNYINIYQCMGHSKMHFFVVGFFFMLNIGFGCHSQYLVEVGGEISKKCYLSRIW